MTRATQEVPKGTPAPVATVTITPLEPELPFSPVSMSREATVVVVASARLPHVRPDDLEDARIEISTYVHGVRAFREALIARLLSDELADRLLVGETDAAQETVARVTGMAADMALARISNGPRLDVPPVH